MFTNQIFSYDYYIYKAICISCQTGEKLKLSLYIFIYVHYEKEWNAIISLYMFIYMPVDIWRCLLFYFVLVGTTLGKQYWHFVGAQFTYVQRC